MAWFLPCDAMPAWYMLS